MLAISLTGCFSDETSLSSICENHPHVCNDIKTKGWCKTERFDIIQSRYRQITTPNDQENLYNSLIKWKKFSSCIEAASNIKRKSIDDRDPTKAASFVNSVREIEKLEQQTVNSQFPQLLYYHWAQSGHDANIDKLIKLDQQNKLDTTELQLMMASYYSKVDQLMAAKAQYNALTLLTQEDLAALDHSIFASLSTHYYQTKELKLSYIWARVAVKFGLKANLYSSLTTQLKRNGIKLSNLDKKADKVFQSIQALSFIPPDKSI